MNEQSQGIKNNLKAIKNRIKSAAQRSNRSAKDITLLAVTKYVTLDDMRSAIDAGITVVGENKVQAAKNKFFQIGPVVGWHMIGHLQTNKARQAAAIFSMVQSVDSTRIADALDKESGHLNRKLEVLVEVNIGREESKFGISPEQTKQLVDYVKQKEHLSLRGLMVMAPYVENPELARPYFKTLNELFQEIKIEQNFGQKWDTLSMGMTNDFEVAIEEGSTLVRIGTGLFSA